MTDPTTLSSVLVTGGVGFVGARVVQHIRRKYPQCRVTVLDIRLPDADTGSAAATAAADDDDDDDDDDDKIEAAAGRQREKSDKSSRDHKTVDGVLYLRCDTTSVKEVEAVFANRLNWSGTSNNNNNNSTIWQVVFHVANYSPPLRERYARRVDDLVFRVNVDGTRNVLHAARNSGVKAFIYTSSICAVTDDFRQSYANIDERWPLVERNQGYAYGESKAVAEKMVLDLDQNHAGLKTCVLRPPPIFGEGDYGFLPPIISCITEKNESPFRLGDGTNLWDTVYVGNVADAHILAAENLILGPFTASGETFFITNQAPINARDFMLQVWKEYNGHIPPFEFSVPTQLAWVLGFLAECYSWVTGSSATLSRGSVADATAMRYTNSEKSRRILGYEPQVGLEEGLRRSCQWLYKHDSEQKERTQAQARPDVKT